MEFDTHWLTVHYREFEYDILDVDPDEFLCFDLLTALETEADKQGVLPCKTPIIKFKHPQSKNLISINSDRDLMEMFQLYQGQRDIDIYVEASSEPSNLVTIWMDWRNKYKDDDSRRADYSDDSKNENEMHNDPGSDDSVEILDVESHVPLATIEADEWEMLYGGEKEPDAPKDDVPIPNQPVQDELDANDLTQPPYDEPTQEPNAENLNEEYNLEAQDKQSGETDEVANAENQNEECNLEAENKQSGETDEDAFSEDSWHDNDSDENDWLDDDKNEEVAGDVAVEGVLDEDENENLEHVQEGGYFSGDEEDGIPPDAPYIKNGKWFEFASDGSVALEVGHLFTNKKHFLNVMEEYCCGYGFEMLRQKNERERFTAVCNNNVECPWRIHASLLPDGITFQIKTLRPDHTCTRVPYSKAVTVRWIMEHIKEDVKANRDIPISALKVILQRKKGVEAPYFSLYRARRNILEELDGSHDKSFSHLYQYTQIVLERNPGSIVDIQYDHAPNHPRVFRRMFICYAALKEGFALGCRPFLGVDGCHLKGPFGGVLLSAIAVDANNGFFPLAFAVVQSETTATWKYFFQNLKKVAPYEERKKWIIISDRQKGVDPALNSELPEVTRRICCRHLYANFRKDNPGSILKKHFWAAAHAYNKKDFGDAITAIKNFSLQAYNYLRNVDDDLWCRHKMLFYVKSSEVTTNFVESFNSKLGDSREKPILVLLEDIRRKLMVKLEKRKEDVRKWKNSISPVAKKLIDIRVNQGRHLDVRAGGHMKFEVGPFDLYYVVDLVERSCDCMTWVISGIPCTHAIAAIRYLRRDPTEFVHEYYSKDAYIRTYSKSITPIPHVSMWPESESTDMDPPPLQRMPGRPKKQRRLEEGEEIHFHRSTVMHCSVCKQPGHNKKGCLHNKNRAGGKGKNTPKAKKKDAGSSSVTRLTKKDLKKKKKSEKRAQDGNIDGAEASSSQKRRKVDGEESTRN